MTSSPTYITDFRVIFESSPDASLILLPDCPKYTIVAASDTYLRAMTTRREEIVGCGIFDVFPANPGDAESHDIANLAASLEIVRHSCAAHEMAVQRYDTRLSKVEGGGFEQRYWLPVNYPVLGPDGKLLYIQHRIKQVEPPDIGDSILAAIVHSSEDAIYATTLDGIITTWNPGAERLYGYTRDEMVGRPLSQLIPPDRNGELPAMLTRVKNGEQIAHFETVRVCKDGRRLTVSISVSPIKNRAGNTAGASIIARDITALKGIERERTQLLASLQQERTRMENIIASVPGVVWEAWGEPDAATQQIDFISPYVEMMLGYSVEEWLSTPNFWLTIVHPEDKEAAAKEALRAYSMEEGHKNTFRWITKGGQAIWVESHSVVVRNELGQPLGMRGVTIDVSDRERARDERERHLAEIENLNARLQRSMRETHHRVKNNLQVISALIDIQTTEHSEIVPVHKLRRLGQLIHGLASIHDLLTRQLRSNAGTEDLSVAAAVEMLAPTLRSMMPDRALVTEIADVRVPLNHGTTLAILINELVSNAIKHGTGDILLRFTVEHNTAFLEVRDAGPGFPDGFDPVTAANTGLDLISTLSEWDLQGSVRFENNASGGATVLVEFPLPETGPPL